MGKLNAFAIRKFQAPSRNTNDAFTIGSDYRPGAIDIADDENAFRWPRVTAGDDDLAVHHAQAAHIIVLMHSNANAVPKVSTRHRCADHEGTGDQDGSVLHAVRKETPFARMGRESARFRAKN